MKRTGRWPKPPSNYGVEPNCNGTKWRAVKRVKNRNVYIGTFDTEARARVARSLFVHWLNRGYELESIPKSLRW